LDISFRFDPKKASYGFLIGVAKFTKSRKTLEEILKVVEKYDLSSNLEDDCSRFADVHESYKDYFVEALKGMILVNQHSTYAMHCMLSEDEDLYVRWITAEVTRYTTLITHLCKTTKEITTIKGLLTNPHLTFNNFKIIISRLVNREIYETYDDDGTEFDFINDYIIKEQYNDYYSRLPKNIKTKFSSLIDKLVDEERGENNESV